MTYAPILAEDYGPLLFGIFVIIAGVWLLGFAALAVNATVGKGKAWGFVLGLIPAICGGLMLFFFLTVRGGAPVFFHIGTAIPFLCGCASLYLWGRGNLESSKKVGLAFRFLLYGVLIIALLYIVTMLAGG